MTDVHTPEVRSRNMAAIHAKDTEPEIRFRKALHGLGFRYRLHPAKIPGHPDLALPKHGVVVFVHGCFWHGHQCASFRWPRTRREFWTTKIRRNRQRDAIVRKAVLAAGWRHLTVWECAFRTGGEMSLSRTASKAARWIRGRSRSGEIGEAQ